MAALLDSTRQGVELSKRLEGVERKLDGVVKSVDTRIGGLENQMMTMNAHLDNLVRESQITNEILRQDQEDRKAEQARRQRIEDDERDHRYKIERLKQETQTQAVAAELAQSKDARDALKVAVAEVWGLFKQPLAYLLTASVAYVIWAYLQVPPQAAGQVVQQATEKPAIALTVGTDAP
jgi:chromosome segregation ATPase